MSTASHSKFQILGLETQLDAFRPGWIEVFVEDPFSAFSYNRGSVLTDFPI